MKVIGFKNVLIVIITITLHSLFLSLSAMLGGKFMALTESIQIIIISLYLLVGIISVIDEKDFFKETEEEIRKIEKENILLALFDRFTILFLVLIILFIKPIVISTQYVFFTNK